MIEGRMISNLHEAQNFEERSSIAKVGDGGHRSGQIVGRKESKESIGLLSLRVHGLLSQL